MITDTPVVLQTGLVGVFLEYTVIKLSSKFGNTL